MTIASAIEKFSHRRGGYWRVWHVEHRRIRGEAFGLVNVLMRGPLCMGSIEVDRLRELIVIERPTEPGWWDRPLMTVGRQRWRLERWAAPADEIDDAMRARAMEIWEPPPYDSDWPRMAVIPMYVLDSVVE